MHTSVRVQEEGVRDGVVGRRKKTGEKTRRDWHFHFLTETYGGQRDAVKDNNKAVYTHTHTGTPTVRTHTQSWRDMAFSSHCLL